MKAFKILICFILALAALAVISGCNLAPVYHTPSTQMAPAFKETNGWKFAQPADRFLKGKWWTNYNDPLLNSLEEQVLVSNQTIVSSFENFLAARALVQQARAAYYPTVSVDPSVTYSHSALTGSGGTGSSNVINGTSGTSRNYSLFSAPADATWVPDLWGAVRNTVRANAYIAQADAALLENMRLTEQADLAVYYFELRGQDEMIQLYRETVKAYRDSVDLTTTLYQTGIDSQLDEAQADALLQTTLAQASALEIARQQYEHAIAVLIGTPASLFSIPPGKIVGRMPLIPVGIPSDLLERRPDVSAAERTVAQTSAQIGITRAAWFPTITITGSAGYENTQLKDLFSPQSFFWAFGATASETIFDAGKRKAANNQAWANYRAAVANYRQSVLAAIQQVEDNLVSLRVLVVESQQQDVAVRASQKSLDLSLDRYRLGIASYLNIISAQETLLGNQQLTITLRMQQMVSSVQLIETLGGGWAATNLPSATSLKLKPAPGG